MNNNSDHLLQEVRSLFQRGDYLAAFSAADRALAEGNASPDLTFLAILSLARSGATSEAAAYMARFGQHLPRNEDVEALEARLKKDRFIKCAGARRQTLGVEAQRAYEAVFRRYGGYFSGINAATLAALIGDESSARNLAREVLSLCDHAPADYWREATRAEALLLCGEREAAAQALRAAVASATDLSARSTTYRQLRSLCEHLSIDREFLTPLRPGTVIHYTGQLADGVGRSKGISAEDEQHLAEQIRAVLREQSVCCAFGSLACGADILIAEQVLAAGAELHVVLPFPVERFIETSVAPAGGTWKERFAAAFSSAHSTHTLSRCGVAPDSLLFGAAAVHAMGLAALRSAVLFAPVRQVAIWNGIAQADGVGTGADVRRWRESGRETIILHLPGGGANNHGTAPSPSLTTNGSHSMRALVFADMVGFSSLDEERLPEFLQHWAAAASALLREHGEEIVFCNSWGDAIFIVTESPIAAARIATDLARMGLPVRGANSTIALRVSAHFGVVYELDDPLVGRRNFFGENVTKTARMEPCTPPSSVFVTEEFAAAVEMQCSGAYWCEYAGEHQLPKGFGRFRMYHLAEGDTSRLTGPDQ